VLLHLVAAEQFRSQQWLVAAVFLHWAFSVEACHGMQQVPENRLANLQAGHPFSKLTLTNRIVTGAALLDNASLAVAA